LTPEYQKAAAAKRTQQMKAEGRAEEIMGTVISAVARAEGIDEKEVQAEFKKNPQNFYSEHKPIVDATMTKLSIEGKAFVKIETSGATGVKGDFLDLIAAFKMMPTGGTEQVQEKKKEKAEEKKEVNEENSEKKLTREKIRENMGEILKGKKID